VTDTGSVQLVFGRITRGFRGFKFRTGCLDIGFGCDLVGPELFLPREGLSGQGLAGFTFLPGGFQAREIATGNQCQRLAPLHMIAFAGIELCDHAADLG